MFFVSVERLRVFVVAFDRRYVEVVDTNVSPFLSGSLDRMSKNEHCREEVCLTDDSCRITDRRELIQKKICTSKSFEHRAAKKSPLTHFHFSFSVSPLGILIFN